MRRREFIALVGGGTVALPFTAGAQQGERVRRIGVLMAFAESDPAAQSQVAAFSRHACEVRMDGRTAISGSSCAGALVMLIRIRTFARELVELRPDAIVGQTTPVTSALARETRTIPIVSQSCPIRSAAASAASFAHPGGNITGFTTNEPAVGGKWMELLKEIAPRTARVGLVFNPATE